MNPLIIVLLVILAGCSAEIAQEPVQPAQEVVVTLYVNNETAAVDASSAANNAQQNEKQATQVP